jgi:hypothetical protein
MILTIILKIGCEKTIILKHQEEKKEEEKKEICSS